MDPQTLQSSNLLYAAYGRRREDTSSQQKKGVNSKMQTREGPGTHDSLVFVAHA